IRTEINKTDQKDGKETVLSAEFKTLNNHELIIEMLKSKIKDGNTNDKFASLLLNEIKSGSTCNLKLFIGIVPDPIFSSVANRTDSILLGIMQGFNDSGYVLDSFNTHWNSPEELENKTNSKEVKSTSKYDSASLREPGVILFRKKSDTKSIDLLDNEFELSLLFLIPETPIEGIDTATFNRALYVVDKLKPNEQLRIIGPNFSGSVSSIQRILNFWNVKKTQDDKKNKIQQDSGDDFLKRILWHNGSATVLDDELQNQYPKIKSFIPTGKVFEEILIEYTNSHENSLLRNDKIAIVSEGTTTYGGLQTNINQENPKIWNYTYPFNIAEIRKRIESNKSNVEKSGLKLQNQEALRIKLDDVGQQSEMLPLAAPAFTASNEEQRLLRIAADINQKDIRNIIIKGTDVLDKIFIAEFFKKHCSNATLLTNGSDVTFQRSEYFSSLGGMIVATANPDGIRDVSEDDLKEYCINQKPNLPNESSFNFYYATLAYFNNNLRHSNKIWVTVNSHKGLFLLKKYNVAKKKFVENIRVDPGFLRINPLTSGVSPSLPLLFLGFFYCLILIYLFLMKRHKKHTKKDNFPLEYKVKMLEKFVPYTKSISQLMNKYGNVNKKSIAKSNFLIYLVGLITLGIIYLKLQLKIEGFPYMGVNFQVLIFTVIWFVPYCFFKN
ncbi:MAG: hypothetical protein ACKO7P_15785, partial [Bacteroidota bacterium]